MSREPGSPLSRSASAWLRQDSERSAGFEIVSQDFEECCLLVFRAAQSGSSVSPTLGSKSKQTMQQPASPSFAACCCLLGLPYDLADDGCICFRNVVEFLSGDTAS